MKIIISADMIKDIFHIEKPSVPDILKNSIIKKMIKDCRVTDIYTDTMDANDLGNLVIKVIPSLKGQKVNGK